MHGANPHIALSRAFRAQHGCATPCLAASQQAAVVGACALQKMAPTRTSRRLGRAPRAVRRVMTT